MLAGISHDEQSGFWNNHSTLIALADVKDYILKHMKMDFLTGARYLDLHKTFDNVDPEIKLLKLSLFGVWGASFE